jgi:glycine hydroxymethyltransferase
MKEKEMELIAELIGVTLKAPEDEANLAKVRSQVGALTRKFPLYPELQ